MNRQMSDLEQQLIDYYNNKLNEEQRHKIESWINASEEAPYILLYVSHRGTTHAQKDKH